MNHKKILKHILSLLECNKIAEDTILYNEHKDTIAKVRGLC